jgi:hypothetical protein
MKRHTAISLTMTLGALCLAGCGGGGSPINSGVDSSKPANEATDAEVEAVCEATADYAAQQVDAADISCRGPAVVLGVLTGAAGGDDDAMQEACTDSYEACLDAQPEEPVEDTTCEDASSAGVDEECDSTVGEIETCLADTVDAYAAAADQIPSCSELTTEYLEDFEEPTTPEEPESCETLDPACPDFFNTTAG